MRPPSGWAGEGDEDGRLESFDSDVFYRLNHFFVLFSSCISWCSFCWVIFLIIFDYFWHYVCRVSLAATAGQRRTHGDDRGIGPEVLQGVWEKRADEMTWPGWVFWWVWMGSRRNGFFWSGRWVVKICLFLSMLGLCGLMPDLCRELWGNGSGGWSAPGGGPRPASWHPSTPNPRNLKPTKTSQNPKPNKCSQQVTSSAASICHNFCSIPLGLRGHLGPAALRTLRSAERPHTEGPAGAKGLLMKGWCRNRRFGFVRKPVYVG